MTVKYGFFNSSNGDRIYDAEDFSRFFDGIIFDGVYSAVGNRFYVEAASGMNITVDTGRAWFDHTWTFNDQKLALEVPAADTVYARYDAAIIEVNKDQRKNFIKIISGTPASNPAKPTLQKTDTITQYALAYITVSANTEVISQADIENVVDSAETPLCSALNLAGLPSGGTIGQVLAKKSATSGDVGWYDVDKLPFDKWYLAQGVTEDNVIGAFKFVNRLNESQALSCVNEKTSHVLSKPNNVTWNTSDGFYIPDNTYLDNATIRNSGGLSIVMKFSNVVTHNGRTILSKDVKTATPLTGNWYSSRSLGIWATVPFATDSHYYVNANALGISGINGTASGSAGTTPAKQVKSSGTYYTDGIIGFSANSDILYRNGVQLSLTSRPSFSGHEATAFCCAGVPRLIGGYRDKSDTSTAWSNPNNHVWGDSFKVQYFVIYNVNLTASQHSEIYSNILSDSAS